MKYNNQKELIAAHGEATVTYSLPPNAYVDRGVAFVWDGYRERYIRQCQLVCLPDGAYFATFETAPRWFKAEKKS